MKPCRTSVDCRRVPRLPVWGRSASTSATTTTLPAELYAPPFSTPTGITYRTKTYIATALHLHRYTSLSTSTATSTTDLWTTGWSRLPRGCYSQLKQVLVSPPVMRSPDFTKLFYLHTDYSSAAIGAVLTQEDDVGNHNVISALLHGFVTVLR